MRIFITGHEGYVGSHMVKAYENLGHIIDTYDGNILNLTDYDAIEKPDAIIHLAAVTSIKLSKEYPVECLTTNVLGSLNIFNMAKHFKVPLINFSSSNASYPINPYAYSKLTAEMLSNEYCINIRPYNIFPGRSDQVISRLKSGEYMVMNILCARDFIHIDDVCEGVIKICENPDYWLNLKSPIDFGSGIPVSVRTLINKYAKYPKELDHNNSKPEGEMIITKANPIFLQEILGRPVKSHIGED